MLLVGCESGSGESPSEDACVALADEECGSSDAGQDDASGDLDANDDAQLDPEEDAELDGGDLDGQETDDDASSPESDSAADDGGLPGNGDAQVDPVAQDVCAMSLRPDLLQVGHSAAVTITRISGGRILTLDAAGTWILWETSTRRALATGSSGIEGTEPEATADLVDTKFVVSRGTEQVEVRASVDGHLLTTIDAPGPVQLANDASYVWGHSIANPRTLRVWSIDGQLLVNRPGTYVWPYVSDIGANPPFVSHIGADTFFAASSELLAVLSTPSGDVIETIAIPSGEVTASAPLSAPFKGWFADGTHYFTKTGAVLGVYARDGTQRQLVQVQSGAGAVGGYGQFFWAWDPEPQITVSKVWRIGTAEPVLSGLQGRPAHFDQGMLALPLWRDGGGYTLYDGRFTIVNLRDDAPETTTLERPLNLAADPNGSIYVGVTNDGSANWVMAKDSLLHVSSTGEARASTALGCGAPIEIAGSDTGRVAIANADGRIRVYDLTLPEHPLVQVLASTVAPASLHMSADGSTIAAQGTDIMVGYNAFSVATGVATSLGPRADFADLARTATILARLHRTGTNSATPTYEVALVDKAGQAQGSPIMVPTVTEHPASDGNNVKVAVSSDGRRVAVATAGDDAGARIVAVIYVDGVLQGAAQGGPVAWVDDTHLLVNRVINNPRGGGWVRDGSYLVDSAGQVVQTLSLPMMARARAIDASRFYSPGHNAIFSTSDGSVSWTGDGPVELDDLGRWTAADLAGSFAVVAKPEGVVLQAWR
jgi:hypothetical protein